MEFSNFSALFPTLSGTEWALLVGITLAIIIGLVPAIVSLIHARRHPPLRMDEKVDGNRLLFTVYCNTEGEVKVHKH